MEPSLKAVRPVALVIEDDATIAELIRAALEHACGCDVVVAPDGATGAQALASRSFDLVIADIQLPDANGAVRSTFTNKSTPMPHLKTCCAPQPPR